MLNLITYGEVVFDSAAGSAVVTNDSGDFAVSINAALKLFEIHLQRDISKCIVFVTAKDPQLDKPPCITVSAQRYERTILRVATQTQDAGMLLRPELINQYGFWFAISDAVPGRIP